MKILKWSVLTFLGFLLALPANSQVQEGDTLNFWSVSYIDWPPLWGTPQRQVQAVCKKAGSHCKVFQEISATNTTQNAIDQLVASFDAHYYPALISKYGPVPDQFDQDSAVYILIFSESDWAGYFDPGQQMSDSVVQGLWNRRSNEHELIYVADQYFNMSAGEIVAHEFGHLLHWGKDHTPEPSEPGIFWESAFVDEGFSTFAAEYLTQNLFQHDVFDANAFFMIEPDIPLIYFSDYDQAQLFMTFMFEHYGQWNYISALIGNPLNSWQGVDSTLRYLGYTETFKDAFEQFCIANYIDDSVYMGGKYSYAHFRFPVCSTVYNNNNFPVPQMNETVSPFGSDYFSFYSPTAQPVEIVFEGDSLSDFRLAFIEIENGTMIKKVISLSPDASGRVVFSADSLGSAYNRLVMAVMCTDTDLDTNEVAHYKYRVNQAAAVPEKEQGTAFAVYPNPAKDTLYLHLPQGMQRETHLDIFDTSGARKAGYLINGNSKSINISQLPSGVYVAKIQVDHVVYSVQFVCAH